ERIIPPHDVDALATQLVDDVLDAAATNTNAGPDAVHLHVDAGDGDLGAIAGLAGDRLDLDGVVCDLGDFRFEQAANEVRVAARQDYLDSVAGLADLHDHGLDALVDVVRLAGDLLAAGQDRLGLAEGHDGGASINSLDGTGDQL